MRDTNYAFVSEGKCWNAVLLFIYNLNSYSFEIRIIT